MKRGTDLKLKFRLLQRKLTLSSWEAKGLLQALWDFTAENAQRGDVGRFTDDEIAAGLDWDRCPGRELVEALVSTRWIDTHPDHRLVVHNWHAHCEDWVLKRVHRAGQLFASLPPDHSGQPTANGGKRCPPTADTVRQRPPIGALPGPGPEPVPGPGPKEHPKSPPPAAPVSSSTRSKPKLKPNPPPGWAFAVVDVLESELQSVEGAAFPKGWRLRSAKAIAEMPECAPELGQLFEASGEKALIDRLVIAVRWAMSPANRDSGYEVEIRSGADLRNKWPQLTNAARRNARASPAAKREKFDTDLQAAIARVTHGRA